MAWNKPTAKDILGMDEAEVTERLNAAKEAREGVATLTTTVNSKFEELTAMIKGLQVKPTTQEPTPKVEEKTEPMPSFLDDEEGAFNARAAKVIGPILSITLENSARMALDSIKRKHSSDFQMFEEELMAELKNAPANYRANDAYVENAFNMVKGRHIDEILDHNSKKAGKYFVEGVSTNGNNIPGDKTNPNEVKLSADELKYVEKFGMKPEDYAKVKGTLKYV